MTDGLPAILDRAPCGFLVFDSENRVTQANRTLLRMLNRDREEVIAQPVNQLFSRVSRIFHQTHLAPMLEVHGEVYEIHTVFCDRSGNDVPVLMNAHRHAGEDGSYTECALMALKTRQQWEDELLHAKHAAEQAERETAQVVEELKEAYDTLSRRQQDLLATQQELETLAITDPLTELRNRRALMDHLEIGFAFATRSQRPLSVLMVDIDHFKALNDREGHPAGDDVLQRVARRLESSARPFDVVARYGGEEFVIVLPDTTGDEAWTVAERHRRTVAEAGEAGPWVTISVGVATWRPEHAGPSSLLEEADSALYEAKRRGRNQVARASAAA